MRNTVFLVLAQVAGMPLSILLNVVLARCLGTADFGHMYVATWVVILAFQFVEWGHGTALPALIAQDRARAPEFLGSSIAWRAGIGVLAALVLAVVCALLRYPRPVQLSVALIFLTSLLSTLGAACLDTIRGFERTDVAAINYIGQQLLNAMLVIPTALLGGGLYGVLIAQLVTATLLAAYSWRSIRLVGITSLVATRDTIRTLFSSGAPFLAFGITMAAQPAVDASFLSKLTPDRVVGWHGGARRLIGVLVFPASALTGALYPTLCRLRIENESEFKRATGSALRSSIVLVAPVALGCLFFGDIGTRILGRNQYAPAERNLQVFSAFLALAYVTMPLGTAILAWGKQRAWTFAQLLCVVVALAFDAPLIRWFQAHTGNGGVGVCVSNVLAETCMVAAAIALVPRGIFDRALMKQLLLTAIAGAAMAGTRYLLPSVSSFAVAPLAVLVYFVVLWAIGGIRRDQLRELYDLTDRLSRKLGRFVRRGA